jgi:hypothetical protein
MTRAVVRLNPVLTPGSKLGLLSGRIYLLQGANSH